MAHLLIDNLNDGFSPSDFKRYNVPYGKHVRLRFRLENTFPKGNSEPKDLVLPVVIIRSPIRWMNSMCQQSYGAKWERTSNRCPNLVVTSRRGKVDMLDTYRVTVDQLQTGYNPAMVTFYPSLADLWTTWYKELSQQLSCKFCMSEFCLLHSLLRPSIACQVF